MPMRSFNQKSQLSCSDAAPERSVQTSKFHVHVALHAELAIGPLVLCVQGQMQTRLRRADLGLS